VEADKPAARLHRGLPPGRSRCAIGGPKPGGAGQAVQGKLVPHKGLRARGTAGRGKSPLQTRRPHLMSVFLTSIFFSYLSSHICASFFFMRAHRRLAFTPRASEPLMSRLTPPALPDSLSPTPM